MATEIPTISPEDAVKMVVQQLTAAGWKLVPSSTAEHAIIEREGDMGMAVSFAPGSAIPLRFVLNLDTETGPMDFAIDFGDQLNTLVSILDDYGPETNDDSYRGVIAALAKLLPAVYFLEDGKTLRQLDLVVWE